MMRFGLGTLAFMTGLLTAPLWGQTRQHGLDTVAAGPEYRASALHRFLLGTEYRSLWYTPVTVEVLDLDRFAGGLRPISQGGGFQTKSLRLAAPDGHEFFFRSVDKDPSATLPPELRGTIAASVVRDQTKSALPTAPLVVDRLLAAAGILHAKTRLVVLPRNGLGEFTDKFGGLMGTLDDRVGGVEGPPSHWQGAREIIGTDSLFARANRSPDDQVDAPAFLIARLFDVFIGDWDRHGDQWVWARFSDSVPHLWEPVPRDRDQAFAKYDGFLLGVARQSIPKLTNFGPKYPYMPGATWNGRNLDRRFLVGLDWPDWKAASDSLRARFTDAVIDSAVAALPPEHYAIAGKSLSAALKKRRDHLEEAARRYYRMLAEQVDVRATDGSDTARVVREANGDLDVTLRGNNSTGSGPYFHRRFVGDATKDLRIYLGPGDDQALVLGHGSGGPQLRILGDADNDQLVDSSGQAKAKFYDEPGGPARTAGHQSKVDLHPYTQPDPNDESFRDWGQRWTASTQASYGPDIGLFIGGGRTFTTYRFRKSPYSSRHRFRLGFATGPTTFRLDYLGEVYRENSRTSFELLLRASGIDVISFSGFGNEIAAPGSNEFYRVTQDAYTVQTAVSLGLTPHGKFRIGPFLRYSSTDNHPDRFLATLGPLYGTGKFGELGGAFDFRFDTRDRANAATRGTAFQIGGSLAPALWDVDSVFGELHGEARAYLSARAPLDPVLAFRVGGKKLWGQYPFFESAFIGGASTVRLGRVNRYAGDASAYGSAELRFSLFQMELVLPAEIGIFGLADAGRVFLAGESSDKWHAAGGGGISIAWLHRAFTVSTAVAAGEEKTSVYIQAGYGF